MATLTQLQAEPWWGREIVTPELDWLGDTLCARLGRPRTAFGSKGDDGHLRGAHRSQEWILNSRYCTSRTYTVQSGLTGEQARHIAGADLTPGAWGTAANRHKMAEQTRRLIDAAHAGRLAGVVEIIGTLDGQTVTGLNVTTGRTISSDSSHLDHWHLTFDRRRLRDRALMERIAAVALGEDDDMAGELADKSLSVLGAHMGTLVQILSRLGIGEDDIFGTDKLHQLQPYWRTGNLRWIAGALAGEQAKTAALVSKVDGLSSALAALAEAVNAGGGSIDTAAVLARIDQRAAEDADRDTAQAARIAELEQQLDAYRQAEADAARAAADALDAN